MDHHFVRVTDADALDQLFARSQEVPVLLFLHDPACPVSAAAYRAMTRGAGEVALIDVASAKELSRAIETRTGVRHESPQVIVLRNGQAVWSASHFAITANAVAQATGTHA